MKKLYIFGMMAMACAGFTSCEADDSPVISEPTEFVLNTPPFAEQLYELTPGGVLEVTCSQPNYGLTLAPTYTVEVSMLEDFGASLPAPEEGEAPYAVAIQHPHPHSAVIELPEDKIAEAICAMRGITSAEDYTEIPPHPLYIRATAAVNDQAITRITSNTIKLDQVKGYSAFSVKTYDILYNPGDANGWNFGSAQQLIGTGAGKYHGFLYLKGGFKFTNAPDWNGINYGDAGAGALSTDGGAGNLQCPAEGEGLYYVVVDTEALTYTTTYVSSVGLVGDFQGWNVESPFAMTSDNNIVWKATASFSGGGFKFVFNGPTTAWSLNLGGTFEEIVFDGDNLPDEAGEHTVTLDLSKIPYTATFE